ncbi:MAG: D-glycero-beta-D-manno-heptose 1,7-bisphosphate 7-phosphatase [Candidatus Omnitrophica bacterium]|nr:D-glycero-beta-D-manno-heptose 1,7-bisphosphate 7-phosphatase [Candidatus Omnitrophota bacterium]
MKAVFIDRDGVINRDPGGWTKYNYVTRWSEFQFIPGATEAISKLNRNGFEIIVISNQAGVNKGYFSREELKTVTKRMLEEINKNGGRIEEVYYCIHRDEDNCDCRKPKTGLLEKAAAKFGIELDKTYFIGDSEVDVVAGRRAGCKTIFVLSGKTSLGEMEKWREKPDYIFNDLMGAVDWMLKKEKRRSVRASRRGK